MDGGRIFYVPKRTSHTDCSQSWLLIAGKNGQVSGLIQLTMIDYNPAFDRTLQCVMKGSI